MALTSKARSLKRPALRFGIGEWYGQSFANLEPDQRAALAAFQLPPQRGKPAPVCPFQPGDVACNKVGGVCSIRLFELLPSGDAKAVEGKRGRLRAVCPNRFEEDGLIQRWVGEHLLGADAPIVVPEVGFLERVVPEAENSAPVEATKDDVGRIDKVLVAPHSKPLAWCALEVQAVYFSGDAMSREWVHIKDHKGAGIPSPVGRRRPDYRSSGPKRLMPQLQIKVPSLRRWGKKMAVVVDIDFWEALGPMVQVGHISNCDIAWFIVRYDETPDGTRLALEKVYLTTLESSVEGLTAGLPVSLEVFEQRILQKLGA